MSDKRIELIASISKYRGHLSLDEIELRHDLFAGGKSKPIKREVVQRSNAVSVLPYDPVKDCVVLIRQFRIGPWANGAEPWLDETPAGLIEEGETAEDVARRETLEEAGCEVHELIPVSSYYSSPGMLTEYLVLFCGIVTAPDSVGNFGLEEEGEDIQARAIPWAEFDKDLDQAVYQDWFQAIGLTKILRILLSGLSMLPGICPR